MSLGHVGVANFLGFAFQLCVGIGLPVLLFVLIYHKMRVKISSFFIGCVTFVAFALLLEQIFHSMVLGMTGPSLQENVWVFGLYGGLAAGIFEEGGRMFAMRVFLKKDLDLPNALMYGAGHGGIEAFLLLGLTAISNFATSVMINTGAIEKTLNSLDAAAAAAMQEQMSVLWTAPPYQFFLGGVERILAICLHLALSVLVYLAVKTGKRYCWILAVALHALVNCTAVVSTSYVPIWGTELIVAVVTAAVVALTVRLYRKEMPVFSEVK